MTGNPELAHPPYSPDLAPTDYHLSQSLAHHPKEKHYDDEDTVKNDLQTFFNSKPQELYKHGIDLLPIRSWRHVIDNDGAYVFD